VPEIGRIIWCSLPSTHLFNHCTREWYDLFFGNSVSKESMLFPNYLVTKVLHLSLLNLASLSNNEKHAFFTVLHTKYISTKKKYKIHLFIDMNQQGIQVFLNLSSIPCFIYILRRRFIL